MTRRQILLALLPPLCFGMSLTIAKPAVGHFPPLFMLFLVYGAIAVVLAFTHREKLRTPWVWILAISACAVTIQGAFIFWGLRGMQATAANLVLQTQVPFAVLLGWLIAGEALDLRKSVGTVLALAGVAIVIGLPTVPPPMLPTALVIAGAFVWALGQVLASRHGRDSGLGTLKLNALGSLPQLALATVLFERGQWQSLVAASPLQWAMLAFIAGVGFYVSYLAWFTLVRQCRMDEIAPFMLLMPVVGIVTAYVTLGEVISPAQVIGGLVILMGLAVVSGLVPLAAKKRAGRAARP